MEHRILKENGEYLTGIESLTYSHQINDGEELRFGAASAAVIELSVFGAVGVEEGEKLVYSKFDGETDTVIGTFWATPAVPGKRKYTVTAYDALAKLDKDFSGRLAELQEEFPMDVSALVAFACEHAGVEIAQDASLAEFEVEAFTLGGVTCRQIVAWAAELSGKYAISTPDGELTFGWYEEEESLSISYTSEGGAIPYKQDGLEYAAWETAPVDAVRVVIDTGDESGIVYQYPTDAAGDNIYYLRGNYLINVADGRADAIARRLYDLLYEFPQYRPATVQLFPFLQPFNVGQIVTVTDDQEVSFAFPVMAITLTPSSAELSSTGRESYSDTENEMQRTVIQSLRRFESRISSVIDERVEGVISQTESLISQTENEIRSEVTENYYSKDATDEKIGAVATSVSQTAEALTIAQTAIAENKEATDEEFAVLHSYIIAEGGTLTFKTDESTVELVIENDRIGIYEDGELVTYWTNKVQVTPKTLTVPEGGTLNLGNFAFIPRSNGSLDFRKVKEDDD